DLLGRVIAGGQTTHHGRNRSGGKADFHDARSVVALARRASNTLVGVRGEEPSSLEVVLEGESDRRAVGLEAVTGARWLAQRTADLAPAAVENQNIRREWIVRSEPASVAVVADPVVALARQASAGFEHVGLEVLLVADERNVGREVQAFCEDFDLEASRDNDVFTVAGIVENAFTFAVLIDAVGPRGDRNGRHRDQSQRDRRPRQLHLGCY